MDVDLDLDNTLVLIGFCVIAGLAQLILYESPSIALWLFRVRADEPWVTQVARRLLAVLLMSSTCALALWLTWRSAMFDFNTKLIVTVLLSACIAGFVYKISRQGKC